MKLYRTVMMQLAIAACILVPSAVAYGDTDPYCAGVAVNEMSTDAVANLMLQGYRGDPTDHREALYPPECFS